MVGLEGGGGGCGQFVPHRPLFDVLLLTEFMQVRVHTDTDDLLSTFPDKNDLSSLRVRREYVQSNENGS
ncbi:unnamed protein product [Heligmosomoides polygyrus]|uniref:Uncharacterized protein n=1 Tax=Heligmosomoides polygyrus TaxID=6339 RepID=A0A183GKD5_HELPZ|nr:unnamed protein product [Heligmosomoides polygyrus]